MSGVLAMFAQPFQAKLDDRRQQSAFERAARSESLEPIKRVVRVAELVSSHLLMPPKEGRWTDSAGPLKREYADAWVAAIVAAKEMEAQQLFSDLEEPSR